MAETTFEHALYPDSTVVLALFREVENVGAVRQAVMRGEFDASLLKASIVLDEFLVTVAANKALHAQRCGKMTTKTLHSEVLFNLSAGKKITEAFRTIGVGDSDTAILAAIVGGKEETQRTLQTLKGLIVGRQVGLDELPSLADMAAIQKEYKLSDGEMSGVSVVGAIATRLAAKDIITV